MSSFWLDPWIKSAWEEQCIWNLSLWMHNKRQSPIFACKIAPLRVLYWAYLMYQIYRMHHMNQTHHKTYQIWNGLRTHCPHVKTAQTESDDMWSKDSSLVVRISTFLWSVNAKAIQQTHRRWHVKLYVEKAFICREGEFLRLETECLADAELFLGALCPDPGRFSSAHQGLIFTFPWGRGGSKWGA